MRSKIKRRLNLICAQNFIFYFILKRETKNLTLYIIFPISDLVNATDNAPVTT